MNERIKQIAEQAGLKVNADGEISAAFFGSVDAGYKKFAELIVRACADAADMGQDAGCEYAGDYVAEYMGYGQPEGVTEWRAKQ